MWQLRREIARWNLPPPRREALMTGLGQAVWRALRRGAVRTTAQLRRLLHEVLGHLREAPAGVSASLKRACAWAGWAVLAALRALNLAPRPSAPERQDPSEDRTEHLRRRLEDLRRLYTAPWLTAEERQALAEEGRRLLAELNGYSCEIEN